ncbi:hypothetical protein Dxin01_00172 [Deinococcus xinjiangensis]|uniref:Uncharacterized protein n=1 Tax=Deinococcus xinjiangensis TaxID=457454 RepID=A0ABP9V736_9DEIO
MEAVFPRLFSVGKPNNITLGAGLSFKKTNSIDSPWAEGHLPFAAVKGKRFGLISDLVAATETWNVVSAPRQPDPEKAPQDNVVLGETYSVQRFRDATRAEVALSIVETYALHGTFWKGVYADQASLSEGTDRHGLWSFKQSDSITASEQSERHGRLLLPAYSDAVTLQDRYLRFSTVEYDSVSLIDYAAQHGLRTHSAREDYFLTESTRINYALGREDYVLTESFERTGRRTLLASDSAEAQDTADLRQARRHAIVSDQVSAGEQAAGLHGLFAKRGFDTVQVQDRLDATNDGAKLVDSYKVEQRLRYVTRQDGLTLAERAGVGTLVTNLSDSDVALLDDSSMRVKLWTLSGPEQVLLEEGASKLATIGRENIQVSDTSEQHGLRVFHRTDAAALGDTGSSSYKWSSEALRVTDQAEQHGLRVFITQEEVATADSGSAHFARRLISETEQVSVSDSLTSVHGRMVKRGFETVQAGDREGQAYERLRVQDRYVFEGRVKNYFSSETIGVGERSGVGMLVIQISAQEQVAYGEAFSQVAAQSVEHGSLEDTYSLYKIPTIYTGETWGLADNAEQHGRRVWKVGDQAGLTERHQNSHQFGQDGASYGERAEQHGLRVWVTRDDTQVGDSGSAHFAKRTISVAEPINLSEQVSSIHGRRLWRATETVQTQDREGLLYERLKLLDSYSFDTKAKLIERFETVGLSERATNGVLLTEIASEDQAASSELYQKQGALLRDHFALYETFDRRGVPLAVWRQDSLGLEEVRLPILNTTPHPADGVTLNDSALELHGRLSFTASETVFAREGAPTRHGRWAVTVRDGGQLVEGRNTPVIARQQDVFTVQDRSDLKAGADWMVLGETSYLEDITQVVRVVDTGRLGTLPKKNAEQFVVADVGWANTSLDYHKNVQIEERRILERWFTEGDEAQVRDKGKVFRKSDFLDPAPIFYDERPGRTRSAIRLVDAPDGSLWAVWLDGQNVVYAKRPYADSWRTHQKVAVPLPFGSGRSCTLIFVEARPTPVVEHDSSLHTYDGVGWSSLPGVDPVTIGGELSYLTPDRLNLVIGGKVQPLTGRGRIDQSFRPAGALVLNDLDQALIELMPAPAREPEPSEEVASARWRVPEGFTAPVTYLAPIEGNLTDE